MNLSALLVIVSPTTVDSMVRRLGAEPGLEVHHVDRATGRLLVLQEAPTIDEEIAGVRRLQALPEVILAEMVEHHFADDPTLSSPVTPALPLALRS